MSEQQPNGNGRFRKPSFDNRISLGSILSAAVVLVAVVAAFYESRGDTRANAQDIANLDRRVVENLNNLDRRVVKVENRVGLGDQVPFERRPR